MASTSINEKDTARTAAFQARLAITPPALATNPGFHGSSHHKVTGFMLHPLATLRLQVGFERGMHYSTMLLNQLVPTELHELSKSNALFITVNTLPMLI
jgi:hypothetical protein